MSIDQFFRFGAALRAAGSGGMQRRVARSLRTTANRRKPYVARYLAAPLPTALKPKGARVRINVAVKLGAGSGVRAYVPKGRAGAGLSYSNAALVDKDGRIMHPVFARRTKPRSSWNWASQNVGGVGWFGRGWRGQAPQFRDGLERAIDDTLDGIADAARGG